MLILRRLEPAVSEENESPTPSRRWFRLIPLGLVGAGLCIAAAVYFGNAMTPGAGTCPARIEAAKAIDAVAGGELAAVTPTGTGRSYSDLAFVDNTGRPMTLKDFAGKPLLVNFWATWCIPCREEMPALNALAAAYSEDLFTVVPINLDTGGDATGKAQSFLADEGLSNLPVLNDPSFAAFERLKATGVALGLPSTILVDADGCEIAILQGPAAWNSEDGHKVIDALIKVGGKEV
jgi:thiol-disulfide isomerase/thioredoxin